MAEPSQFLADDFEPPYYAVIFSSQRTGEGRSDYEETAVQMMALAKEQPGFLGVESLDAGPGGITVSYWRDEASILAWKENLDHARARAEGNRLWYSDYRLRVAKVERAYSKG